MLYKKLHFGSNSLKFRFKLFLLFLFSYSSSQSVFSQIEPDTITLSNSISYIENNNPLLIIERLKMDQAKADHSISKESILPSLNGNLNNNLLFGRFVDPFTNQFKNGNIYSNNVSLTSSLNLFQGGKYWYQLKQTDVATEVQKENINITKKELMEDVIHLFCVYNQFRDLKVIVNNRITQDAIEYSRIKKLIDNGILSQSAMVELEFESSKNKNMRNEIDNNLLLMKHQICSLLGIAFKEGIYIETLGNTTIDTTQYLSINIEEKTNIDPEFKSSSLRINQANWELKLTKSKIYPSIMLNHSIYTGYSQGYVQYDPVAQRNIIIPFENQLRTNVNQLVTLSLKVPIYGQSYYRGQIKKSGLDYTIAQKTLDYQKNKISDEYREREMKANIEMDNYKSSLKQMELSKSLLEITTKKFQQGRITTFEYLVIQNQHFDTMMSNIKAKYSYMAYYLALTQSY